MQSSNESFDYTQRAFNFLESVRNADQTFNETNDDSYIFPLRRETYEVNKVWDDDYENDNLGD